MKVFYWIIGINFIFDLGFSFWVGADAKRNRRPAAQWFFVSLIIGAVFGALEGALSYYVYYQAIERGYNGRSWAAFCAVFSIPAYVTFSVYDDCKSRAMNAHLWSAIAFVLTLAGLVPGLIFIAVLSRTRPPVVKPTITVESIKQRYAQRQLLQQSDNMLVRVESLKKYFPVRAGIFARTRDYVKAVDDVSFYLRPQETLGLVGESGCGKTTLGRTILKLIPPTAGRVFFDGLPIELLSESEMRVMRKEMQVIFQDPFGSLNPRMNIENIVGEPMTVHKIAEANRRRELVVQLLERVGLSEEHLERYPHEFSGGQRQRIGIARSLALNPRFIVCDEPVSALDVSIQAQIINLLKDLQQEFGISYLFIAHDLRVVEFISHRVAVMYLGKIVELTSSEELYRSPRHPYTVALMSAIPIPDPERKRSRIILPGDVPSPINPPPGCSFHPRCFNALPVCSSVIPGLIEHTLGHFFACHNPVSPNSLLREEGKIAARATAKIQDLTSKHQI
jgi:oligopeptide/dipeptide ABC transporter ATP-binding protein